MEQEELKTILDGIDSSKILQYALHKVKMESWRKLFALYNEHHPERHMGMGCYPCWTKVYQFACERLKQCECSKNPSLSP